MERTMTKKEKNEQRHKMAVAIFREMTPEKQAALIEENKKKHALMCVNRKTKQELHREMLKAGREFVLKNNVLLFYGRIGGYALAAGALLETQPPENDGMSPTIVYKVAYTLCSPKDSYSAHYAKGYIGGRLMDAKQHPYVFYIGLSKSGALIPERLAQLARLHVELDIVSKRVQVPARLQRFVLKGHGDSALTPAPKIPRTSQKRMKAATKVLP
jgi:hypothetical protein